MLFAQLLVVSGKTHLAGEFLSEVTDEPLSLEVCTAVLLRISVGVDGFDFIDKLDVAKLNVQPIVDRLDMIAAFNLIIIERKRHVAGFYLSPRAIFHGISQCLLQHTADDIVAEELFERAAALG